MTPASLTDPAARAHTRWMARWLGGMMGMLGAGLASGCVTVKAPSAPIVIELNINIKQEVIYQLAADAGNTIEENSDIF